jgi:hypothetical protein
VIISDSLATTIFKSGDPIGRRLLRVSVDPEHPSEERAIETEIVGVVRNQNETSTMEWPADVPPMFVPLRRRSEGRLMLRRTGPAESLIPTVMSFLTRKTDMHLFLATSATLVTLAVVSVASLASWMPARRAATVDPMEALRSE